MSDSVCEICYESPNETALPCLHRFCKECLQQFLTININDGNVFELFCPSCNWRFTEKIILELTNPNVVDKYIKFTSIKEILKNKRVKICPQPDCRGYDECTNNNFKLTCRACKHQYCFWCSSAWHSGKCKKDKIDKLDYLKTDGKLKLCPRCKSYISKKGGCNKVTCSKCNFDFCWMCKCEMNWRHKRFYCFTGRKWNNLYWRTILLMIFFPFTWLYLFYAYFWYRLVTYDLSLSFKSRIKNVVHVLVFIFSPVLTILALPLWLLIKALKCVLEDLPQVNRCLALFLVRGICVIGFFILMPLSYLLFASVVVVLSAVLPVLGIFFGMAKVIRKRNRHADDLSFMNNH